jgi:hypothetical protein
MPRTFFPLFLLLVAACGPSGSFQLSARNYYADQLTATRLANPPAGKVGVDVVLKSDPERNAVDDEVQVRVTLLWDAASPPPLNREISVSDGAISAIVRMGCFCGGSDTTFTEPAVSGKFSFTSLDDELGIEGSLDLSFKGQIGLLSGGVLYEDETLRVRASRFLAK